MKTTVIPKGRKEERREEGKKEGMKEGRKEGRERGKEKNCMEEKSGRLYLRLLTGTR